MNPLDLLVDVRAQTEPKDKYLKYKVKTSKIDTLCLHQMACKDSDNQGWKRWKKLGAHWCITEGENAKAYWLHDFNRRLPTSHDYNARSIGFEIEGYFAGVGVEEKTLCKKSSYGANTKTTRCLYSCL